MSDVEAKLERGKSADVHVFPACPAGGSQAAKAARPRRSAADYPRHDWHRHRAGPGHVERLYGGAMDARRYGPRLCRDDGA